MKRLLFLLMLVAVACSCHRNTRQPAPTPHVIAPLPSGLDPDHLSDATVAASFSLGNFNWMGGNLTMTVYCETLYDAVEIQLMQPGDTLVYDRQKLVVQQKTEENGGLSVNGGLENGGVWLVSNGGGTYKAVQFDDHPVYIELGRTSLPLDDDVVIVQCGDFPDAPSDTIRTDQKLYLERLPEYKQTFSCLNTRVRIEHGLITCIERYWIP